MKPSSGHSKQIDVATDVYSYNIQPTVIRHQANARERYRTHRFFIFQTKSDIETNENLIQFQFFSFSNTQV